MTGNWTRGKGRRPKEALGIDGSTVRVLLALIDHCARQPYPPTVRELCFAVGRSSTSTIQKHLDTLQRHGLVEHRPDSPRTLRPLVRVVQP